MSESLRKVCQIAVLVLLAFLVIGVLTKASFAEDGANPIRLTSTPDLETPPQIATRADGSAIVAWVQRKASDDDPVLYVAQSPRWGPTPVTPLPPSSNGQYSIAVAADERVHIAYSQITTQTQRIWHHVLGEENTKQPWQLPYHARSAFTVDTSGRLHYVWTEDEAIRYINSTQTATVTVNIDPSEVVGDVALDVDGRGNAHLTWRGRNVAEGTSRIYHTPLVTDTTPATVTQGGKAPELAVEPSGRAHLCWRSDDGLYYTSSGDWSEMKLIDDRITPLDAYALSAGPGQEAHMVWTAEGKLWYAHSVDWNASRRQISSSATMRQLKVAVDDRGSPHLTWVTEQDAGWDIFYQRAFSIRHQIAVCHPQQGDFFTRDTWAKAEINGNAEELLRVEFYLQVDDPLDEASHHTDYPLRELGIDRKGRDGWAVPLPIADLKEIERYRIMALATDTKGQTIRAVGGWFRALPPQGPCTTLRLAISEPVRGASYVQALTHCQHTPYKRLHLYLLPASETMEARIPLPDTLQYVGSYPYPDRETVSPPTPWKLAYDSERFPDGRYVAVAIAEDEEGRRSYLWPTEPFVIDNAMAPTLEVTQPRKGTVITGQELRVSATAEDVDGTVEQVDFYLEKRHSLAQEYNKSGSPLEQSHFFWLGQDTNGTDDWDLRVPIDPAWHGENCRIWATAFDQGGLQKSTHSGTFSLLGRDQPQMRILAPTPDSPLCGTVSVRVSIRGGADVVRDPQIYLQAPNGPLTLLGPLEKRGSYFIHEWDTWELPDGPYHLLAVGQNDAGHTFSSDSERFLVDNGPPPYRFVEPLSGQMVSGTIRVGLESTTDPVPLEEAFLYYRDKAGELFPIAEDNHIQKRWETTWNTRRVLDGTYRLVALLTDTEGDIRRLEREVTVRNTTPHITFVSFPTESVWRDSHRIRWQTHHPLEIPLSTSLEYSADGGNSWSEIASDIQTETSFLWNTTSAFDGRQGRLRLSVTDGVRHSRVTSGHFVLNNANEAPEITALAPKPGAINKGQTQIAWQAWDPDTDPLTIALAYRRGEGAWTPIASDLPNTGKHLWDTSQLPPDSDYILRITARDAAGTTATDLVKGLELVDNTAPSVRLLWPSTKTRLEDTTTILWSARDIDEYPLAIDIYYSDNGGQGWIPLAEGVPNTGFYEWQVSYLPVGAQYRVKVVARDRYSQASDESDDVFTIGRNLRPRITLLAPTAGQTVSGIQPIRWTAFDPEGVSPEISVTIRYKGTESWEFLGTSSFNEGFLLWDTRDFPDGEYDLRAVATNGRYSTSTSLTQPVSISNEKSQAPHVRLTSPQGGEIWNGTREIVWEAWDSEGEPITATLSTRPAGESEWEDIALTNGRAGYRIWDTPKISPGDGYMLRIVVENPALSTSTATSSPVHLTNRDSHPPHIRTLSPEATELLQNDIIGWNADDPDGDSLTVGLSIRDRDRGPWQELATGLYNSGEYVLDFPLHSERTYQIRAMASDAIHSSEIVSRPFTPSISAKQLPDLTLDIPKDRKVWSGTEEIRWQATDPSGQDLTVNIELSRNGGETWDMLERRLQDTGSYMWDTTTHANGPCLLRLTVDNGHFETTRVSHPLILSNPGGTPPTVSLLSPRGGETWSGIQEIRWLAQDKDDDQLRIDLAYKIAGHDVWHTIAQAIPNAGRYAWDTVGVPNCDHIRIRITARDGAFVAKDESHTPFTVNNHHAPLIKLIAPQDGERWSGRQKIRWITAQETRMTRVTVQLSTDAGRRWETLASDLPPAGTYLWDTMTVPHRSAVWIRVIAEEYTQKAIDTSAEPVIVYNETPHPSLPFYLR